MIRSPSCGAKSPLCSRSSRSIGGRVVRVAEGKPELRSVARFTLSPHGQSALEWISPMPLPSRRPIIITPWVLTCPPRAAILERTLSHLGGTDWDEPLRIHLDQGGAEGPEGNAILR